MTLGAADADLVARARGGDAAALDALYRRHASTVHAVAWTRLRGDGDAAHDVVQETFVKVFDRIDAIEDPARFGAFCRGVAANVAATMARTRRRADAAVRRAADARPPGEAESASEVAARREVAAAVAEAIAELPERYQLVLALRFLEGLSYREVADAIAEPFDVVRGLIGRGGRMLRERLAHLVPDERSPLIR